MKTVNFYIREEGHKDGIGQVLCQAFGWPDDHPKEWYLRFYDKLIENIREYYPKAEFIDAMLTVAPKEGFTKEKLLKIGQEVASGWGAVCTGVKTFPKCVQFNCNEFGEKFTTTLTYEEIKEEYAYML